MKVNKTFPTSCRLQHAPAVTSQGGSNSLLHELVSATMAAKSAMLMLATWVFGVTSGQIIGPGLPPRKGCALTLNNTYYGYFDVEPKGDPLLLNVSIRVYYLRDVPDSGGSFGVDVR